MFYIGWTTAPNVIRTKQRVQRPAVMPPGELRTA
jgi:hypothetical protein